MEISSERVERFSLMPRARSSSKNSSTANLGFEAKLWLVAANSYFTFDFDYDSDWFREDDDVRWQFGVPSRGD